MAKQIVNIGSSVNKGDGDPLRTAFDKINDNFDELYAATTLDLDSIGSNMIPTTDGTFALGSATKQWSDVYVKDFLYIGGVRLQADAQGNITVDGGSLQIKDVQGDIFADDSTKVFDSATQTFTGRFEGDITGSVFGDDSTLLVDGNNNKIVGPIESTSILPGNGLTDIGSTGNRFYNAWFTGQVETDSVLANIFYGPLTGNVTGDVTGSVFADDSTLLVDSVNGLIPTGILNGTISNNIDTASLRTSEDKIALGFTAGETNQGLQGIGIGSGAGRLNQNDNGIAIGSTAGYTDQGSGAIGFGVGAGYTDQGERAIAIGQNAGLTTQGNSAVAIGDNAGETTQGAESVAIGKGSGETTQGTYAQAIGNNAGNTGQGQNAVALGSQAGETNQGAKAIALGQYAGQTSQAANSIVINATGIALQNTTASSLVIKPIRNATMTTILGYDATSGEVTHNAAIPGYISLADLKTEVAASADFADFQTRIAAL